MELNKHTAQKFVALFNKRFFHGQVTRHFFWVMLAGAGVVTFFLWIFLLPDSESLPKNQVFQYAGVSTANGIKNAPELNAMPSGKVVYQRPDGIYTITIGAPKPQRLVEYGTYPRWSPDGRFVAFVAGNRIMLVSALGGEPQFIASATKAKAVCFSPDGRSLLFTDGINLRRVDLKQKNITTVLEGYEFLEIDAAGNGSRLAATIRTLTGFSVRAFDLHTGENRLVARGCAASLSPDGSIITVNGRKHNTLNMYQWDSLKQVNQIDAPANGKFDNHFWSNSQSWVVSTSEGERHDIYIHHVPSNTSYRITTSGDCDRGDFFSLDEE